MQSKPFRQRITCAIGMATLVGPVLLSLGGCVVTPQRIAQLSPGIMSPDNPCQPGKDPIHDFFAEAKIATGESPDQAYSFCAKTNDAQEEGESILGLLDSLNQLDLQNAADACVAHNGVPYDGTDMSGNPVIVCTGDPAVRECGWNAVLVSRRGGFMCSDGARPRNMRRRGYQQPGEP